MNSSDVVRAFTQSGRSISSVCVVCIGINSILHFHAITETCCNFVIYCLASYVFVALDEIQSIDWIAADEFQLAVTKLENLIPVTNSIK
jgi:hypothetical protein